MVEYLLLVKWTIHWMKLQFYPWKNWQAAAMKTQPWFLSQSQAGSSFYNRWASGGYRRAQGVGRSLLTASEHLCFHFLDWIWKSKVPLLNPHSSLPASLPQRQEWLYGNQTPWPRLEIRSLQLTLEGPNPFFDSQSPTPLPSPMPPHHTLTGNL